MQASVYIATSVDGYIARPDGGIDWLESVEMPEGEDFGYAEFSASIDALIMGRNTFDVVAAMDVDWPYSVPVFVVSNRDLDIPAELADRVHHRSGTPTELCAALTGEGFEHVWVDGGQLITSFLAAGLISRLTVTTLPLLLGAGIPLFGQLDDDVRLSLVSAQGYSNGMTQSVYQVLAP